MEASVEYLNLELRAAGIKSEKLIILPTKRLRSSKSKRAPTHRKIRSVPVDSGTTKGPEESFSEATKAGQDSQDATSIRSFAFTTTSAVKAFRRMGHAVEHLQPTKRLTVGRQHSDADSQAALGEVRTIGCKPLVVASSVCLFVLLVFLAQCAITMLHAFPTVQGRGGKALSCFRAGEAKREDKTKNSTQKKRMDRCRHPNHTIYPWAATAGEKEKEFHEKIISEATTNRCPYPVILHGEHLCLLGSRS